MAGITDRVFRDICRQQGADFAVSEMVASKKNLWQSQKSSTRHAQKDELSPRIVQLIGTDPQELADAAKWQTQQGAEMIDFNMGCPAKKVCNVSAGSALMAETDKVKHIFTALVEATHLPITVKIRTGSDSHNQNAVEIAQLAESCGLSAVSIHGRTRTDKFQGHAEYETIRLVKQAVKIPVLANGDISSPEKASFVLKYTAADGLLIGRAAQGYPWIFREIQHFLQFHTQMPSPSIEEFSKVIFQHLEGLYQQYGEEHGVRIARKHLGWYSQHLIQGDTLRRQFNRLTTHSAQLSLVEEYFNQL